MANLTIKKYESSEFNDYSNAEVLLDKKVEAVNLFMPIVSNGAYGNYDRSILEARLPENIKNKDYKEIETVKDFINQLDGVNGDSKVYFLLKDNAPVSVAMFTKSENQDAYILEMIMTHKDHKAMGYVTTLLKSAFAELKSSANQIIAKINEKNEESLSFISDLNKQSLALNEKINALCKVEANTNGVYQAIFFISDLAINLYKEKMTEKEI